MLFYEKKIFNILNHYKLILLFIVVTLLSLSMRITGLSFHSNDMDYFLLKWFAEIKSLGSQALNTQVGDYNIPYQFIIFILTKFQFPAILAYKFISIFFDYLTAIMAGLISILLNRNSPNKHIYFIMCYSFVLFSPLVIFNSSFWGQADSIYSFFAIASLYFILKKQTLVSFIMLGIAFAFKLQTIFLLPIFILIYVIKRNYSLIYFAIIPIMMYFLSIPGLLAGRNFLSPFTIYLNQTSTYKSMSMNTPNFWALFNLKDYLHLHIFATLLSLGIIILGLGYIWITNSNIANNSIVALAIWCIWTCVMFMPSMHERYNYIAEILVLVLCTYKSKYFSLAIFMILPTLTSYIAYLFHSENTRLYLISSVLYLFGYIVLSYWIFGNNSFLCDSTKIKRHTE